MAVTVADPVTSTRWHFIQNGGCRCVDPCNPEVSETIDNWPINPPVFDQDGRVRAPVDRADAVGGAIVQLGDTDPVDGIRTILAAQQRAKYKAQKLINKGEAIAAKLTCSMALCRGEESNLPRITAVVAMPIATVAKAKRSNTGRTANGPATTNSSSRLDSQPKTMPPTRWSRLARKIPLAKTTRTTSATAASIYGRQSPNPLPAIKM